MEDDISAALEENAREFYENALFMEKKGDFNSAITLFFKVIAVLSDLFIYKKEGKVPSSHSERFRILEQKYPEIYFLIDKDFPFYQDSYKLKLNKEVCEVLRKDAERLFDILRIKK